MHGTHCVYAGLTPTKDHLNTLSMMPERISHLRNSDNTLDLPINSDVRVWREKGGWKGPYKLLATNGETCTVAMPHGPANFRSTVVKPYYIEEIPEDEQQRGQANEQQNGEQGQDQADQISQSDDNVIIGETDQPQSRGR